VIFYRSRRTLKLPKIKVVRRPKAFRLELDPAWLAENSLAAVALDAERDQWASVGYALES
jgi:exopolyphosphatase / guanosine-5'-triphosphate,3'-diphosphate pyrophosphatase